MGETSSIVEVIELAITREIQAAEFYAELAGRMGNSAMKSLFQRLSEEELRHRARLELEMMKEGFVAQTVGKFVEVDTPDYAAETEIDPNLGYKDALSLAVRKERRAFRFYVQLAGIAPGEQVHKVLLELAEEEARHMVQFEMEYNRLTLKHK